GATLALGDIQSGRAGNYGVVVWNSVGSITSAVAILVVIQPPEITSSPMNMTADLAGSVIFCVTAAGTEPLNYQWRRNGVIIPAATNACYTNLSVKLADGGAYSVVVANEAGSITSEPALLLLNLPSVNGADDLMNRASVTGLTNAVRGTNIGFSEET